MPHMWNSLMERGGKREQKTDVAKASVSAAQFRFQNSLRSLVLDVQNAFVDVFLAGDNLSFVQQNYDALDRIVQINTARVKSGDLAEVDLQRRFSVREIGEPINIGVGSV